MTALPFTLLRRSGLLILALIAPAADAHVKWFALYDIIQPPLPIDAVLTSTFVYFFIASVVSVYVFFLVDRTLDRKNFAATLEHRLRQLDDLAINIMRLCACVFFVSLWVYHHFTQVSFFLTPELHTGQPLISWLQLAIGLCALWRRALPLIGVGITGLYGSAVAAYGVYHLLDYVIFLGIAYFFLVSSRAGRWKKSGFTVLFAATGITLLWAAIEKFAYPHWTYPLLTTHASLCMGLSPYVYMVLAGFVEFNVAFLLLGATSILTRMVALGLNAVFVAAIYMFGLIDAVGHLMIIAILLILVVKGPTDARRILVLREKPLWVEAGFMTSLYVLAFVSFFVMYYGFHHLA
jgi:hypothetical protein